MPLWFFAIGVLHVPIYSFALCPQYLLLGTVCLWLLGRYKCKQSSLFLNCGACFLGGAALGGLQVNALCDSQLPKAYEASIQELSFQIVSIPSVQKQSVTFLAEVTGVHCPDSNEGARPCPELSGRKIRLSWYYSKEKLEAGQIWRASVKLKRPRGLVNPNGFDYQAWLLSQGLIATGYIRQGAETKPTLLGASVVLASIRQGLKDRLLYDESIQFKRFWAALLVGDRSGLSADDWETLQVTGTVHLMAISGLHIGLVAYACFAFGALLAKLYSILGVGSGATLYRYLPPLSSILGALYYSALAGFSIPTLRALTACALLNLCLMASVKHSSFFLFGVCVAVVAVLEPFAWVSSGFWLSFTAVGLLLYCFGSRKGGRTQWAWFNLQIALSVGMLLPMVFIGQGVSLAAPFANIIAVPVVSLAVVPILLIASILQPWSNTGSELLMHLIDSIFFYLWQFLEYLQLMPLARWWPSQELSLAVLLTGFIGSLLLLSPVGARVRGLGCIWLLCAAFGRFSTEAPFRLTVLDVGQGLAVHLQVQELNWLYDTGPSYSSGHDSGSRIVLPYLRSLGVDGASMIVSHDDSDHSGGAASLLKGLSVERLYIGETLEGAVLNDTTQVARCEQGQSWHAGPLVFSALWPPVDSVYEGNRASCVILVRYQHLNKTLTILLTGDIDRFVEKRILSVLPRAVDILIAPHHGSNSSSSASFIKHLKPKHVVFSRGYGNRYRHPHEKVLSRYYDSGAQLYDTATDGAVRFTLSEEEGLTIDRYRVRGLRRWFYDGVD